MRSSNDCVKMNVSHLYMTWTINEWLIEGLTSFLLIIRCSLYLYAAENPWYDAPKLLYGLHVSMICGLARSKDGLHDIRLLNFLCFCIVFVYLPATCIHHAQPRIQVPGLSCAMPHPQVYMCLCKIYYALWYGTLGRFPWHASCTRRQRCSGANWNIHSKLETFGTLPSILLGFLSSFHSRTVPFLVSWLKEPPVMTLRMSTQTLSFPLSLMRPFSLRHLWAFVSTNEAFDLFLRPVCSWRSSFSWHYSFLFSSCKCVVMSFLPWRKHVFTVSSLPISVRSSVLDIKSAQHYKSEKFIYRYI